MKHLIDGREPITPGDIDQAQLDAQDFLDGLDVYDADQWTGTPYLVRRLLAIVDDTYGPTMAGG